MRKVGKAFRKSGIEPVLSKIESQIDEGKPVLLENVEYVLEELFSSQEDWIAWCERWSGDERKESVILNSLGNILTKLTNYEPSEIRARAVELVKIFAEKKGINYEKETKGIEFKSDSNTGWENKEKAIKALQVLLAIRFPKISIDIETLSNNLKKAPHLSKAIGDDWLIKNATSDKPHILAYIFHQKLPGEGELELLQKKWEKEPDENKRFGIAFEYRVLLRALQYQNYCENVFRRLEQHKIKIRKSKLRDVDNAKNILAEAEVLSRLAPFFEIAIEPDIEELRPKKLEALIEFEGEEVLIEVATVEERREVLLAQGFGSFPAPGGKVKNVLCSKFEGQLKEGKTDSGIPILLILNLEVFSGQFEVQNGIYGELAFRWKMRNNTSEEPVTGVTRKEDGFYHEEGTNIVTAVAAYKRDLNKKDPLVGKLYRPPIAPINKISQKFWLRIRNALFGKSETSNWKSLKRVYGIDEQMAKLLYSRGIEDLGVLVGIQEDEFVVEGVPWEKLSQLRDEARRVRGAISTDSVRFLKGMDKENFDILKRNGIYLIKDILELETPPEGISHDVWALITEDAKRVSKSE